MARRTPWIPRAPTRAASQRLLILGQSGTLGSALVRRCRERGLEFLALGRGDVDITRASASGERSAQCQPWAVINATGFVDVDRAEVDADGCMAVNSSGARTGRRGLRACGSAPGHLLVGPGLRWLEPLTVPREPPCCRRSTRMGAARSHWSNRCSNLAEALVIRTSAFIDAQ